MLIIKGLWKVRLMFPELSESQFQVLMFYAFGTDNECIADVLKCSVSSVKQIQKRIKINLHLDKLDTVRGIYHARVQTALMASDNFPENYYESMYKK